MSIDYPAWFAEAKSELQVLQQHREELQRQLAETDKKMSSLAKTLSALAPLAGEEPPPSPPDPGSGGITDRIRSILRQSGEPLSPVQIRDLLEEAGCDLNGYVNPLSTIHTVLRRLLEGREIRELPLILDGKRYRCFVGMAAAWRENSRMGFHPDMKKEQQ